jgi:anaerobic dimethyl sulfoxide reductase subunit C (anchor subunit)
MNVREWALPIYTILMQIAVGTFLMLWIIRVKGRSELDEQEMYPIMINPMTIGVFTIIVAMIGAHFHLSKPYLSLMSILNFRSSWLSREITFTILFFFTAGFLWFLQIKKSNQIKLKSIIGWIAILFGWVTIYCMAQIYLLPTQISWNSSLTIAYFLTTTLLLGATATAAIMIMDLRFAEVRGAEAPPYRIPILRDSLTWLTILTFIMVIAVFAITIFQILFLEKAEPPAATSLDLLLGLYRPLFILRLFMMFIGVVWLIYSMVQVTQIGRSVRDLLTPIYASCLFVMVGEILGRFLFYATHVRLGI